MNNNGSNRENFRKKSTEVLPLSPFAYIFHKNKWKATYVWNTFENFRKMFVSCMYVPITQSTSWQQKKSFSDCKFNFKLKMEQPSCHRGDEYKSKALEVNDSVLKLRQLWDWRKGVIKLRIIRTSKEKYGPSFCQIFGKEFWKWSKLSNTSVYLQWLRFLETLILW